MNVFVHVFFNSVPKFDPPYHLSSPTNKILRVLINNVKYTLFIGSARYLIRPDYATEDDWRNVIFDSSIPLGISDLRETGGKEEYGAKNFTPKGNIAAYKSYLFHKAANINIIWRANRISKTALNIGLRRALLLLSAPCNPPYRCLPFHPLNHITLILDRIL